MLLQANADTAATDAEGNTPLHLAVKVHAQAITALRDFWPYGEQWDGISWKHSGSQILRDIEQAPHREQETVTGHTPLHVAILSLLPIKREIGQVMGR
jgi:hypothetical protein